MCDTENQNALQKGMNYRLNPSYTVILMSQRTNAPYKDKIYDDGITIEYEGHDIPNKNHNSPKQQNQVTQLPSGKLTQNGKFVKAVEEYKIGSKPELAKVYEKIMDGVWSLKGIFELVDYKIVNDGSRNVFRFILKLTNIKSIVGERTENVSLSHTRIIPSEVKKEVWKRDKGICVFPDCGSNENLHFDHELPFSKGGTSLTAKNVRLLCMRHNLQKSAKIE